jgi:hypothetical protein
LAVLSGGPGGEPSFGLTIGAGWHPCVTGTASAWEASRCASGYGAARPTRGNVPLHGEQLVAVIQLASSVPRIVPSASLRRDSWSTSSVPNVRTAAASKCGRLIDRPRRTSDDECEHISSWPSSSLPVQAPHRHPPRGRVLVRRNRTVERTSTAIPRVLRRAAARTGAPIPRREAARLHARTG